MFMRVIMLVLMCTGIVQAQSKSGIIPMSEFGASWFWKSQTGVTTDTNWELNPKQSHLTWMGKPIVGSGHEGTIQLNSGSLVTSSSGQITKGELWVDMTTIKNTDMKPDDGGKDLEDHLKNDDFFSVAKFPRASFSILKVVPDATDKTGQIKITGLLTIKGITNQVEFTATTVISKENISVKADLIIDRTKWDIIYQSNSIFKNLKDGVISDEIKITVDLNFFIGC